MYFRGKWNVRFPALLGDYQEGGETGSTKMSEVWNKFMVSFKPIIQRNLQPAPATIWLRFQVTFEVEQWPDERTWKEHLLARLAGSDATIPIMPNTPTLPGS